MVHDLTSRTELRKDTSLRSIKVLHFVECWLTRTETWLYNHIRFLPKEVESYVVCQWTQNLDQFPAKSLFSAEMSPCRANLFQRASRRLGWWDDRERHLPLLKKVIDDVKPHLLHSHFGNYGWINSKVALEYHLPHVVSFYGFDVAYLPKQERRWRSRYRQMSDRVDRVLCEGPHMARSIVNLGLESSRAHVFRLGIDLSRISFVPRARTEGDKLRILIAGTFREKKGIPYAFRALGLFSKSHPDVAITVIGDAGPSEREQIEKSKILNQVRSWGLVEKTRFLGYQPHDVLIQEFYNHDIFLSPSVTASDGDTEGGAPVTIIEAAASGMPVVSTRHCDIPFVLSGENQAFLVPERDSEGLCRAIEALVRCRDWGPIVSANRKFIEEELDVRRQGQELADVYQRVLDRRKQDVQH